MKKVLKRAGAIALASTLFATSLSAADSSARAQERAEPIRLEVVLDDSRQQAEPAAPEVRFVPGEIVQNVPDAVPEQPAPPAPSLHQLVADTDTSSEMSREVMCLAQAVYFESRGEPLAGQLAVARVIINRAASDLFPDDYCSVVTQRSQFSFVRGGRIPAPEDSSPAWQRAQAIARIAHRDLWTSDAGDALYFHATHVRPSWAGRLATRARIQNHIFYR